MADIKLPPLPKLLPRADGWTYLNAYTEVQLRARDLEVARVVLEAAASVCDATAVDATSEKRMKFLTVQGKAIYEGMYGGAINCACGIRALEVSHD